MSAESEKRWRDMLPATNLFDKSVDLVASFDRLMVTIYSGLIAGSVLLLLKEEVSLWVGAALVLALACFVIGIGHTLIHIGFMSKMLLLAEALANGKGMVQGRRTKMNLFFRAFLIPNARLLLFS